MKCYSFGSEEKPVILLLPGTCCHWKATFEEVIPLLTPDFHVVCVSYDGFDETEPEAVFPDMLTETGKLEDYIKAQFGGRIFAAYGCSLGGSFVSLLVQRKNIHIDHAILGSSDMDQGGGLGAKLQGKLVAPMLVKILKQGKLPGWMQRQMDKKPPEDREYMEKFISLFCGGGRMAFVKKESIYNQFYSDLITPVEDGIDVNGTTVHCFYAAKMGAQYEARYRQHFKNPDIRRHDLNHEELLVHYPERWAAEVRRSCGLEPEEA